MAKSNAKRSAPARSSATAKPAAAAHRFSGRTLDARPDRLDFRDLPYRAPLRSLPTRWPSDEAVAKYIATYTKAGLVLDQGTEGACTGFGLACVANYLLWIRHLQSGGKGKLGTVSPRMFYELARRYDEWPGEDYDGSSCRGALKGWHKHGVCDCTLWPYPLAEDGTPQFVQPLKDWAKDAVTRPLGVYYRIDRQSVVDLQAAIHEIGAVYVSAQVHAGWDQLVSPRPTAAPKRMADLDVIPPKPQNGRLGGHAFALVGYDERGFVVQNSWGEIWGKGGFAILPYDDWVQHATDAWACALGVPITASPERLRATAFRVAGGQSLTTLDRAARNPRNPNDDPWPIDHTFDHQPYEPWSTATAYEHTLVSGNDGQLLVSDLTFGVDSPPDDYARHVVVDLPAKWLSKQSGSTVKLALYAHGGLNSESASIERIRVLAPYFEANGMYPLFLTWKTGPVETLLSMLDDRFGGLHKEIDARAGGVFDWAREAADRLVESSARLLLRGIWTEMRENAAYSTRDGHALDLAASHLLDLRDVLAQQGKKLEIHLVGHSAGSILLGHLLKRWAQPDLLSRKPTVRSCSLYAAACSVQFALDTYGLADQHGILKLSDLQMSYLSDENEQSDGLPGPKVAIYGKSLLYLVSRALDDVRKIPLLGMERALLPAFAKDTEQWAEDHLPAVREWQKRWKPAPDSVVASPFVTIDKRGTQAQAVHGSFDNDIAVLTRTISGIAGRKLVAPMEWLDY
ncbi:MAG: C1 family peptidase [Burkholderiales bacterium]|nr:C1 family peptidase [Burkholderiales bacterium]